MIREEDQADQEQQQDPSGSSHPLEQVVELGQPCPQEPGSHS